MTDRPLASYHHVWLAQHPERSETWLKEKMREGFDIHHIDGSYALDIP